MSAYTPTTESVRAHYVTAMAKSLKSADYLADLPQMFAEFDRWLQQVKAEVWEEGAQAAWLRTGEGWNGEYAEGTHDGSRSFRDCNPDTTNPYRTQDRK